MVERSNPGGLRADRARAERRAAAAEAEVARLKRDLRPGDALASDLLFTLAKVVLWFVFAAWVLLVLISFPAYIWIAHDEPPLGASIDPMLQGVGMAVLVDIGYSPIGLTSAFGAYGLSKGTRWGYAVALAAGGLSVLFFCIPVAGIVFWALLREPVRRAFFPPAPGPAGAAR